QCPIGLILMKRLLLIFCGILLLQPAVFAQTEGEAPLVGPVVAAVPSQQDRILLYDMGAAEIVTRALEFGRGELHIWDFSPDGCRVLFTQDRNDNGLPRLYSARLDGSD